MPPGAARRSIASCWRKQEAAGIAPNGPADRRVLIRRAYFDLIGLPPTPAEVEAFLNDASPQACEKVIDRLLAVAHYGERWARHWLDLARFAESHGFEHDYDRPDRLPLSRLRHQGAQRRSALRHVREVADRRRRVCPGQPAGPDGDRLPGGRRSHHADHQERSRTAPLRRARRHAGDDRHRVPRPDDRLCPLPRSQVRSDSPSATTTACSRRSRRPSAAKRNSTSNRRSSRPRKRNFDRQQRPLAEALAKFEREQLPGRLAKRRGRPQG